MLDDPLPFHDLEVFSAIADITGWPPKVIPCVYIDLPVRNVEATRVLPDPDRADDRDLHAPL
jgi:hypothetical protein